MIFTEGGCLQWVAYVSMYNNAPLVIKHFPSSRFPVYLVVVIVTHNCDSSRLDDVMQ